MAATTATTVNLAFLVESLAASVNSMQMQLHQLTLQQQEFIRLLQRYFQAPSGCCAAHNAIPPEVPSPAAVVRIPPETLTPASKTEYRVSPVEPEKPQEPAQPRASPANQSDGKSRPVVPRPEGRPTSSPVSRSPCATPISRASSRSDLSVYTAPNQRPPAYSPGVPRHHSGTDSPSSHSDASDRQASTRGDRWNRAADGNETTRRTEALQRPTPEKLATGHWHTTVTSGFHSLQRANGGDAHLTSRSVPSSNGSQRFSPDQALDHICGDARGFAPRVSETACEPVEDHGREDSILSDMSMDSRQFITSMGLVPVPSSQRSNRETGSSATDWPR
eukprot:TRINITY_DN8473_c1_g1_i1.p1 TRINITY_DN8473_c1_g1~~TRINITY_DN8473_c1_g1_i1.p1  ORF type:complete len:343 (+),score=31.43 TRINITY_DN8473_c1_g1_i1:29-1030(+)